MALHFLENNEFLVLVRSGKVFWLTRFCPTFLLDLKFSQECQTLSNLHFLRVSKSFPNNLRDLCLCPLRDAGTKVGQGHGHSGPITREANRQLTFNSIVKEIYCSIERALLPPAPLIKGQERRLPPAPPSPESGVPVPS